LLSPFELDPTVRHTKTHASPVTMSALSASAFVAPVLARRALRGAKPTRARAARVRVNAAVRFHQ
jgi:hypothetical protein